MKLITNTQNINLPAVAMMSEPLTMSSREIAELLEKRHDKVKQSIERLAERGTIVQPSMGDEVTEATTPTGGRRKLTTSVYRLEKRDSFVVVAQLSPEFTARIVDRWQELEEQVATGGFAIPRNFGEALRLAADQAEQIEAMREDVQAHERLVNAEGSLNITESAKNLGIRPKDLFSWMSANGWIYKRAGGQSWLGYQARCNAGDLEHKSTTVLRADGTERISEQVRVTPKGLSKLAKLVPSVAKEVK